MRDLLAETQIQRREGERYVAAIRVVIDNRYYLICGRSRSREIIVSIRIRYSALELFLCIHAIVLFWCVTGEHKAYYRMLRISSQQ